MKKNLILFFLMFFMAAFARAEKNYNKDRAECKFDGEKITLNLQSPDLITESPDDSYGESLQIEHNGSLYPVTISEQINGRYKLLRGNNEICNKPLALKISKDELAIFLTKDNRPFADTLMVLYYNVRSRTSDFTASKILTKSGFISDGKAYFKLASSENTEKFGTVLIKKQKYNYMERAFEPWIAFDGKNFRLDRQKSYDNFEQKDLIKLSDLDELSEFRELRYRYAIDPQHGKRCISLNQQNWVCR